jgi:hypothetical protein
MFDLLGLPIVLLLLTAPRIFLGCDRAVDKSVPRTRRKMPFPIRIATNDGAIVFAKVWLTRDPRKLVSDILGNSVEILLIAYDLPQFENFFALRWRRLQEFCYQMLPTRLFPLERLLILMSDPRHR